MIRYRLPVIALMVSLSFITTNRADDTTEAPKAYSPKGGKWSAVFPSAPKEVVQKVQGIELKMYAHETATGAYMVGIAKMPLEEEMTAEEIDMRLKGARDGAVANVGGKLITDKKITLGGKYPGIELTASITRPTEGLVRQRIYLVGNEMYQILVVGTEDIVKSKASTDFLNSLQLKK